MGKFDKYAGKIKLEVDGDVWEVKPSIKQIAKFMQMDKDKTQTEAGFVNMTESLVDILQKSYPDEPRENLEAAVLKNMDTMVGELVVKMEWTTKEKLQAAIKEEEDKDKGKASQEAKKL